MKTLDGDTIIDYRRGRVVTIAWHEKGIMIRETTECGSGASDFESKFYTAKPTGDEVTRLNRLGKWLEYKSLLTKTSEAI